jgi:hypothetical protein
VAKKAKGVKKGKRGQASFPELGFVAFLLLFFFFFFFFVRLVVTVVHSCATGLWQCERSFGC